MFNADKTHFVVDTNESRTITPKNDEDVILTDVVSRNEGMTMMVMLGSRSQEGMQILFMIFQNKDCYTQIKELRNTILGFCYRTKARGCIDSRVFEERLTRKYIMPLLPHSKRRALLVDNASGHKGTEQIKEGLVKSNTELAFLPTNGTGLFQPANYSITQKIKIV